MKYYLAKTDPETYSIEDLARDERTVWDGVTNPQAVKTLREMKTGDRIFIYHSGGRAAVMGLAEVVSDPRPDPGNAKSALVGIRFLTRLAPPTSLAEIKAIDRFSEWALVRQGRLSTMPVPDSFVRWARKRYPEAGI